MEPDGLFLMMLACIFAASIIVLTIRRAAPARTEFSVTPSSIEELSTDRYRPMLRLLDAADLQVLRSQPGYKPEIIARLRRQRCQIFRGYLRLLQDDFGQVCHALKLLMVHAKDDRRDLAFVLIRSRLRFAFGMALIQVRLGLYRCGVGTVNVASVLHTFEHLQDELRSLIPSVALGA